MCKCRVVDVEGRKATVCVGKVEEEVGVFVLDVVLVAWTDGYGSAR